MSKQNPITPSSLFGFFGNLSQDDWLSGMGITGGIQALKVAEDAASNLEEFDPLRAALAVQDFHDAYHTQGMKDAVNCLLCFDYDERHGQYHPVTGEDVDGQGCRDCDYPPNDDGWHRWDCPATADPRAAHYSI